MRTTIAVQGAREHNLKNVDLEIPRDRLVVFTGVSGSGKSSLAFDTIYAEGQRRYLESLSSFVRNFVDQVQKPHVDFVFGLSPVVSIGQKTVTNSPRSTVGTMTDIAGYLNLLFATVGVGHCPYCRAEIPVRTANQITEQIMLLPEGTAVELRAPVFPVYGEDLNFLFAEVRKKGYRKLIVDGAPLDISEDMELDEGRVHEMQVVIDTLRIKPALEKPLKAAVGQALNVGERFLSVYLPGGERLTGFGCPEHGFVMGGVSSEDFMFNNPKSACRTCLGVGTYQQVHPTLLVPDRSRSIAGGAFVPQAFRYNRDTWDGKMMYSLARHYGFSLDTPFCQLPDRIVDLLFYGTKGEKFTLLLPEGAKEDKNVGRELKFDGIITRIERHYRRYRQQEVAHTHMEDYLNKVMVEHRCPDCRGARLRPQRLLTTVGGKNLYEIGEWNFAELKAFLDGLEFTGQRRQAGQEILREVTSRLDLLVGIGLDYLNFNRRSGTLSGGESQRIRLSTQIGSGLMGMLYVLDEPSIGLHPKDTQKLIAMLQHLRDLGNTVLVVEHDEDTIRAADWVVEMGPGAGVHGGEVVAQGTLDDLLTHERSLTGQFLSGRCRIAVPNRRRAGNGKFLTVRGARENNLHNLDVAFPLGTFIAVTGASGSGKSSLINEILYKRLYAQFVDSRTLPGDHDAVEGIEHVSAVIRIDQSPIGRTPRSNPATYVGFYDDIRQLFAGTPESLRRGYTAARFSFNVKGGRCEECAGHGIVTERLSFMPDVEIPCETCKGTRYNADTLEVTYNGKTIAEVLDLSIEEGVCFFKDRPTLARKIDMLHQLGLGYLTLGQSATTLSGGEAQRVKLSTELGKVKRGGRILYILDEPTTGLHLADIQRLLECLNRLVEAGNTVLVIEHHMDVIKTADWIIDLGPEGGHSGGEIIAIGTPEEVVTNAASHTGRFLRPYLQT
jgi:excinuclease ABC subunit A